MTLGKAAINDCQPVTNYISSLYLLAIHDYGLQLIKKLYISVRQNIFCGKCSILDLQGVLSSNQLINPITHAKVSWALKQSLSRSVGKTMMRETAAWTLVKIIVWQSLFKNMKEIHRTTAKVRIDNIRCFLRTKGTGLLLSGPKSFFHMKVNFAFHLEIKVPE